MTSRRKTPVENERDRLMKLEELSSRIRAQMHSLRR
jgi:hypothetical protein